jgi:hypothetical protein
MLVRGWARGGIAWFGIPAVCFDIGLITVIFGLLRWAHLSPQEHRNSDQERSSNDQWWRQCRQIREHAGHLLELAFVPMIRLLAL